MSAMMRRTGAALLCGLLIWIRCGTDPVSGGTSTSENGRVAGRIVTTGGMAASQVQVTLVPAAYDPIKNSAVVPKTDTTDASGSYSFAGIARGEYAVQSVHIDVRTRGLLRGIHVAGDTADVPSDTLRNPGSIKIIVPETTDVASGYVYIPGTTISAKFNSNGTSVLLDSVPAGTIPEVAYASTEAVRPTILRYGVVVRQEDTALVQNTSWKYSRPLRFNTTNTSAGIGETLHRFPVLIRLTETIFNFSQAQDGGGDLLFTKQNNTVLPCEIERWDAENRVAEVWVKVDTLPGNDSGRFFTMYWGNPQATAGSNGCAVFDTSDGFGAVWHLAGSGDTLHDATGNRSHGLRYGNLLQTPCMIGYGQTFDGGAYCDMGNVLNPGSGSFTISAWVKRASTGLQTIIAKSTGSAPSSTYGWSLSFGIGDQLHCFIAGGGSAWGDAGAFDFWSKTDAAVTDTATWHYVVAMVDRSNSRNCKTFIDGIDLTDNASGTVTGVGDLFNSLALRIGAEADGDYKWTGSIDECSVSNNARPEAWIRLCYINQGPNDRLVEFR